MKKSHMASSDLLSFPSSSSSSSSSFFDFDFFNYFLFLFFLPSCCLLQKAVEKVQIDEDQVVGLAPQEQDAQQTQQLQQQEQEQEQEETPGTYHILFKDSLVVS